MFLDVENISNLLHKLYKGDLEYVVKLYWYINYIKNGENKDVAALVKALKRGGGIQFDLYKRHNKKIILNFMFLIKDLKSLLVKLKDLNVNAGPQSERGKCSLLDANLSRFDESFRETMYLDCK